MCSGDTWNSTEAANVPLISDTFSISSSDKSCCKNPTKIHRAVKYTKDAINNRNVIYGKMPLSQSARKVTFYEEDENRYGYDIRTVRTGPEDDSKKKDFSKMTFELQKRTDQRFENLEAMLKQLMARTRYCTLQSPPQSTRKPESACYKCKNQGHVHSQETCQTLASGRYESSVITFRKGVKVGPFSDLHYTPPCPIGVIYRAYKTFDQARSMFKINILNSIKHFKWYGGKHKQFNGYKRSDMK